MFRLDVSHLQAPITFASPDALPTLGSHSVYSCVICKVFLETLTLARRGEDEGDHSPN